MGSQTGKYVSMFSDISSLGIQESLFACQHYVVSIHYVFGRSQASPLSSDYTAHSSYTQMVDPWQFCEGKV